MIMEPICTDGAEDWWLLLASCKPALWFCGHLDGLSLDWMDSARRPESLGFRGTFSIPPRWYSRRYRFFFFAPLPACAAVAGMPGVAFPQNHCRILDGHVSVLVCHSTLGACCWTDDSGVGTTSGGHACPNPSRWYGGRRITAGRLDAPRSRRQLCDKTNEPCMHRR